MKHVLPRLFRPRKPASAGRSNLPPPDACFGCCSPCEQRSNAGRCTLLLSTATVMGKSMTQMYGRPSSSNHISRPDLCPSIISTLKLLLRCNF